MIKYIVLAFNALCIVFISLLNGDINVEINAPKEITAGNDFTVEVLIIKGKLETFARFQQELPPGFSATPINVANGDFTFEEQKIKIIWLQLTTKDTIVLTYNIHVDETASGIFKLCGKFSYIHENDRKTIDAECEEIIVMPGSLSDDATNNINNTDINNTSENISCHRKRVVSVVSDKEIIVELLVNKKDFSNNEFAKIQENIPIGYSAKGIETQGSIFAFKDQKVKFLWMTLPQEDEFIISYKIISDNVIDMNNIALNGTFSYIEKGNTKSINILEKEFESNVLVDNNDGVDNNDVVEITNPQTGVSYSVQICALKKYRNPTFFNKNKYNLKDQIKTEAHEGWNKYTIGAFNLYKEARDYRVNVWETTIIDDAFVSAYNNGTRITVQEALMIANQKWYQ